MRIKYIYGFIVIVSTVLMGCTSSSQSNPECDSLPKAPSQELIEILWGYNDQISAYPSPYCTERKANFDFDNQVFQYNYEEIWDETMTAEEEQHKIDASRLSILESLIKNDQEGTYRRFLEILLRDGYGLRFQYVGKYKNNEKRDTIQIEVSTEEIKLLLEQN